VKEHELKTWPSGFKAIAAGLKHYELRKDDRGFEVGDTLKLMEYDPDRGRFTRRWINARVTFISRAHGEFRGLEDGFVVMGIKPVRSWYGMLVHRDDW